MSGSGIQEALLNQKFEFLQIELEDSKKREDNLKRINESLMQAMSLNDPSPLKVRLI